MVGVALGFEQACAQLSYSGGLVVQDFDSLPASGPFDLSDFGIAKGPALLTSTPLSAVNAQGWGVYAQVGTQLIFTVDSGLVGTASAYSYGIHAAQDRALGSLAGSGQRAYLGWRILNNTGQTLTQFTLSLIAEQWRNGGTASLVGLEGEYRIASSGDINSGTYTDLSALDAPAMIAVTTGGFALHGNAQAYRQERSATVTGLSWPPGQMLILRWRDLDETGADNGLALDDVLFHAPTQPTLPLVHAVTPESGASNVLPAGVLEVVFNQPVNVGASAFELVGSVSGALSVTETHMGPLRFRLMSSTNFVPGETITLRVVSSQVTNTSAQVMAADHVSSFTVLPAATTLTRIHQVQGRDGYSPMTGAEVSVRGVVVADFQGSSPALGGFYLQEELAEQDGDSDTSEGIWIADENSSASVNVSVGEVVQVTGTVSESGSLTQLSQITAIIKMGVSAPLDPVSISLPMTSLIALERYEGMKVVLPQTLWVSSNSGSTGTTDGFARYGELLLSAEGVLVTPTEFIDPNDVPASGITSQGRTNAAAIHQQEQAHNLRSLILDDASRAEYPDPTPHLNAEGTRRCGDTVTGLTGILTYTGGAYRLQPTETVPWVDSNPRLLTPPTSSGRLKFASMNVLNYFTTFGGSSDRGASNVSEFQRQKSKIITALKGLDADVLGLIEIQNATVALQDLLTALNSAVSPDSYSLVANPAGGAAGDVIRTAWLYRASRVTPIGPCYADQDSVWNTPAPLRYPLAQVFEEVSTGERVLACLNHWKSKSSSSASGANNDQNDGQAAFNEQRRLQSARLHVWLQGVVSTVGDQDVLILGDLNAYGQEDPLDLLRGNGYSDQCERFVPGDYSYRIGGQRGRLDHAFASSTMSTQVLSATHWHINADEPAFYDYNMENKTAAQLLVNGGTAFRSSDHDPVIVGVSLAPQPTSYAMWEASRTWAPGADTTVMGDPDLDRLPNLMEFVLNTSPESSSLMQLPIAQRSQDQMHLDYRSRVQLAGVQVIPQWSENLIDWHDITSTSSSGAVDVRTEIRRASISTQGKTRLFMRLKISQP